MTTYASDGFLPSTSEYTKRKADIKVATPDIILEEEIISSETITDAYFAEIGGTEILASARSISVDSPLHSGSSLIIDTGLEFVSDARTETNQPEDLFVELNVSRYFPIDSNNLAAYIDKTLGELDESFSSLSDNTRTTLPGYIEIYLNNFPPGYEIEVEVINDALAEDAIIYKGEG